MNVGFTQNSTHITLSYSDRALLYCGREMQWVKEKCTVLQMRSADAEFLCFPQHILPPFDPPFTLRHCDKLFSAFSCTGFRDR